MPERTLHDSRLNTDGKYMKNSQICSELDIAQDVLETQQQWKLFRLCLAKTENKSKTDWINEKEYVDHLEHSKCKPKELNGIRIASS